MINVLCVHVPLITKLMLIFYIQCKWKPYQKILHAVYMYTRSILNAASILKMHNDRYAQIFCWIFYVIMYFYCLLEWRCWISKWQHCKSAFRQTCYQPTCTRIHEGISEQEKGLIPTSVCVCVPPPFMF